MGTLGREVSCGHHWSAAPQSKPYNFSTLQRSAGGAPFLPSLRTAALICTRRINDQSERQLSGRTLLNFLFNFAGSHVMHFSSFAGQVQKIQTELGVGLISPFRGCSDWGRELSPALALAGPGSDSRDSSGPSTAALVIVTLSLARRLTLLGLIQSRAKTFPPGMELPEGSVCVQCHKNAEFSDCPWL